MSGLYPEHTTLRKLQTIVDELQTKPGLTIVEDATASGKTEFAMAYASNLLSAGCAESISFALPTMATANSMLKRMESVGN